MKPIRSAERNHGRFMDEIWWNHGGFAGLSIEPEPRFLGKAPFFTTAKQRAEFRTLQYRGPEFAKTCELTYYLGQAAIAERGSKRKIWESYHDWINSQHDLPTYEYLRSSLRSDDFIPIGVARSYFSAYAENMESGDPLGIQQRAISAAIDVREALGHSSLVTSLL